MKKNRNPGCIQTAILSCVFLFSGFSAYAQSEPYTGPIIDMHVHAYRQASRMFGITYQNPITGKTYATTPDLESHREWTFKKMQEHRIVKAVVNYHPDWYDQDPDRVLIGLGTAEPDTLRRMYEAGRLHVMGEMTAYYDGLQADDPELEPYFELAESLGIPVGYHIFPGGPPGGMYMGFPGIRAANADPMQIERVLVSHPKLKIYIMHAGWPYIEDMKALMYAHPQLYVDIGVISWNLPRAEFHSYLKALVDAGFGKRILYGTDQMAFKGSFDQAIENVNTAGFLSLEQKADIFYNNAAEFLGLSPEEVRAHKLEGGNGK